MNILVVYSATALHTNTVRDYVEAFGKYLPSTVFYEPIEADESVHYSHRLDLVDIVIVHYSANFQYGYFGATKLLRRLGRFKGFKILFTQDDYDWTNKIRDGIKALRPDVVYSVLPTETAELVYKEEIEQGIQFRNCLTGYVPERLQNLNIKPISERTIDVGYRGRTLPPWYGQLGFEKVRIGLEFKEQSGNTLLRTDIESDTTKRIYGSDWDAFLGNCKTTLASESGCNVFDFDGKVRESVIRARKKNPEISDSELYGKFIAQHEGLYPPTNQISPKMFEAVALGTVLVMFEGSYSGIFEADRHYIAVKKDFSNFDDVVSRITNKPYVQQMSDLAYREILENPEYSYRRFCENLWKYVTEAHNFENYSPIDLTEAVGRGSRLAQSLDRFSESMKIQWWGVGKSIQYLNEWGLRIWLKKVSFLVMRKIKNICK